jgi:hypothetical protein
MINAMQKVLVEHQVAEVAILADHTIVRLIKDVKDI